MAHYLGNSPYFVPCRLRVLGAEVIQRVWNVNLSLTYLRRYSDETGRYKINQC